MRAPHQQSVPRGHLKGTRITMSHKPDHIVGTPLEAVHDALNQQSGGTGVLPLADVSDIQALEALAAVGGATVEGDTVRLTFEEPEGGHDEAEEAEHRASNVTAAAKPHRFASHKPDHIVGTPLEAVHDALNQQSGGTGVLPLADVSDIQALEALAAVGGATVEGDTVRLTFEEPEGGHDEAEEAEHRASNVTAAAKPHRFAQGEES